MTDTSKRLHYYKGQFLREREFIDEQSYHVAHQRDHVRLLHTPGIAEGLEIRDPPPGASEVIVTEGVAYVGQGRRIRLIDEKRLALADVVGQYITIAYRETQT